MGLNWKDSTFQSTGDTSTRFQSRNSCFLLYLILNINIVYHSVEAGLCWVGPNANGRCTDLLKSEVTEEDCCNGVVSANLGIASTAYSTQELTSGQLFYQRVLRGGVPCAPCKSSCEGVQCGAGMQCELNNQLQPKCICAPKCSRRKRRMGSVCGTDGRTYRHICRLLKRKCRKDSTLTVDYYGKCEESCDRVRCVNSKTCVLDNNYRPHCVRCRQYCPPVSADSRPICAVNNNTYASYCHLQRAACLSGTAIQVAYRGECKLNASCQSISCGRSRKCLTDVRSHDGRCVTCPMPCPPHLKSNKDLADSKVLCASNNMTYPDWCSMMNDSCRTGIYLHVVSGGPCPTNDGIGTNVIDQNSPLPTKLFNPNHKIAPNR